MATLSDVVAWRPLADVRSLWRIHGSKPCATAINALILYLMILSASSRSTALVLFLLYCCGADMIFGRCIGMMVVGKYWIGRPTMMQKLIYNTSYVGCFALMLDNMIACALVMAAQIICVIATGKTTHGLLAGMDSLKACSRAAGRPGSLHCRQPA